MNTRICVMDALLEMKAPIWGSNGTTYDFDSDYENIIWQENVTLEQKPTKEQVREKITELELDLPFSHLRQIRNFKLKKTDVYSLPDFPHSNETTKQAWLTYRQQLRDLPANSSPQLDDDGILTNVVFPTPPS